MNDKMVMRTEGNTFAVDAKEVTLRPAKALRFDFPIERDGVTLENWIESVVRHCRDLHGYSGMVTMVDHIWLKRHAPIANKIVSIIYIHHEKCFHIVDSARVEEFLCGDFDSNVEVDKDFHLSMDAAVWAKNFLTIVKGNQLAVDEDLMIGWFANSLMRGHDDGVNKTYDQLGIVRPGLEPYRTGVPLRMLVEVGILPITALYPDPDARDFGEWLKDKQDQLQTALTKEKDNE